MTNTIITDVKNAARTFLEKERWKRYVGFAEKKQSLSWSLLRYCLSIIIGMLLMFTLTNKVMPTRKNVSYTTAQNVEQMYAVIMKYKQQIARDDKILDLFMGGDWKRECQIEVFPEEIWADGTIINGLRYVNCEDNNET